MVAVRIAVPALITLCSIGTIVSRSALADSPNSTDTAISESSPPSNPNAGWLAKFWEDLAFQRKSTVGLLSVQGTSQEETKFNPTRELRITDKSKMIYDSLSFNWHLRLHVNRNVLRKDGNIDDPYITKALTLPNGSVLDRGYQFIVQEAYLQKSSDNYLLQIGTIAHPWVSADTINPMSVFNPQDVRLGFLGDKDLQTAPIPSARLALMDEGSTLNFVYSPWRAATLQPMRGQNWYVTPTNFTSFSIDYQMNRQIETAQNFAIKYDTTITSGDLSLLYYRGADYDFVGTPLGTRIENNQPLIIDIQQTTPEKTLFGASYSKTLDNWVLKAEGTYTLDKKVMPEVKIDNIDNQSQVFPIALVSSPAYQTTVGFNYFASIKSFFGIPLSETVFLAEYYRQRFLRKNLTQPFLGDLVVTGLRTTFLEGRLEALGSYVYDAFAKGASWGGKLTFSGDDLKHSLNWQNFDGKMPESRQIGSVFYYWRNNDLVSYDVSYQF